MAEFNQIIYGKKTLSDIFRDIDTNHSKTEKQITELITALKPFINSPGEAVMIVPLIKGYLEVKVQNDEHLVKMASIVQRAIQAGQKRENGDTWLSDSELEQLHGEIKQLGNSQYQTIQSLPDPEKVKKNEN